VILQVIDHREHLRGQCIIGTQSLWGALDKKMAMETAGYYMLLPLFGGIEVDSFQKHLT